ncbi:hypothetical protein GCM10027456_38270 [Kineosporia babensis]
MERSTGLERGPELVHDVRRRGRSGVSNPFGSPQHFADLHDRALDVLQPDNDIPPMRFSLNLGRMPFPVPQFRLVIGPSGDPAVETGPQCLNRPAGLFQSKCCTTENEDQGAGPEADAFQVTGEIASSVMKLSPDSSQFTLEAVVRTTVVLEGPSQNPFVGRVEVTVEIEYASETTYQITHEITNNFSSTHQLLDQSVPLSAVEHRSPASERA